MPGREFKLVAKEAFEANPEIPVLDARTIPHDLRHGAVLGVAARLRVGQQFDLLALKDPQPMLRELRDAEGDAVTYTYEDETPGAYRLRFTRVKPLSR